MKLITAQHYWQHTTINTVYLHHAVLRLIYINLLSLCLCIIQLYRLFIKTTNTKLTKYVWYNNLINVSSLFQIHLLLLNKFSNVMLPITKLYKARLIYILTYLRKQQLHIYLWCCQILIILIMKQYIITAITQYTVVLYQRVIIFGH